MIFVVTGTSSGLGYEIAKKLTASQTVIALSRSIGKAKALMNSSSFHWLSCDFSSVDVVYMLDLIREINSIAKDEEICLVLNAGIFYAGPDRYEIVDLENMMRVNFYSAYTLTEHLKKSNLRRVFFVNSVSGLVGQSNQHEYVSTKHALMGYARSLSKEAKNSNYDVMVVNPGGIKTELWNDSNIATHDFIEVEPLAEFFCMLMNLKQRIFIDEMVILPPSDK